MYKDMQITFKTVECWHLFEIFSVVSSDSGVHSNFIFLKMFLNKYLLLLKVITGFSFVVGYFDLFVLIKPYLIRAVTRDLYTSYYWSKRVNWRNNKYNIKKKLSLNDGIRVGIWNSILYSPTKYCHLHKSGVLCFLKPFSVDIFLKFSP
jgi:hypothetical protein